MVCLLPIGGFLFLETGSVIARGIALASVLQFGLSLGLILAVWFQLGISTFTGGLSLALTLCILDDSRNAFADFFTHFNAGLLYFAILWGVLLATAVLAILTSMFSSPALGNWVIPIGLLFVVGLSFKMLMAWYDWEWVTAFIVLVITYIIQALIGYGARQVLLALMA